MENGNYSLIFNRDELNSRQRALPPVLKRGRRGTAFLSPTDTDAGGSWLMVNEYGVTACLLNFYAADQAPSDDVHSRGEIVLMLTGCQSVADAERVVQVLDTSHYRGFDLVLFDGRQAPVQYRWDADSLTRHTPTVPLTSSSYRSNKICLYRRQLFNRATPKNLQQLLEFHGCHYASHIPAPTPAYGPCMHREDAKTVSQCVVEVSGAQVSIRYADGSPCCAPLSAPLTLDRITDREAQPACAAAL